MYYFQKLNSLIKKHWPYILLALFLLVLFFLPRFYEYYNRFGFDWDQENIAFEAKQIIKDHKLTLLGPRANNDKGFFLGPQFTYLIVPFFIISRLHPNALLYFLIVYNVTFFLLAFFILKRMFNLMYAYFFLLVWSVNFLLIEADTSILWPILLPLGIILTIFCLYKIYYQKGLKWWPILGLVVGFFANMHFEFVFIGLFVFIFLLFSFRSAKPSLLKIAGLLLGLLLMFAPLILFDLRHDFFNTKLFISFFTTKDPNVAPYFFNWFPVFQNVVYPFIFSKVSFITNIFYFVILCISSLLTYRKKEFQKMFYFSFAILWITFPIFFSIYGKRPSEYYFNFLYPFIVLILVDFIITFKQFILGSIYLFLYLWLNIYTFLPRITQYGLNFANKERAVLAIKYITDMKPCDVAFNVPLGRQVGYKYLFEYYHIRQVGDWKTCVINLNIPPKPGDVQYDYIGLTLPKKKIVN